MSYRQDKLILLIDTGTSSQVRRTAAKQLSDIAVKSFRASRTVVKDEVKPLPNVAINGNDINASVHSKEENGIEEEETVSTSKNGDGEDVKPDAEVKAEIISAEKVSLQSTSTEEDAWIEVLETVAKLLPLLRSKISDTRHAAAHALGLLAGTLPGWTQPIVPYSQSIPPVHLPTLLRDEAPLLASAGREYVAKHTGGDKAKRRKAMMGSLGLGDAVGWGDDVDKVIGDEDDDVDMDRAAKSPALVAMTSSPAPPKDIFEGLSARQVTMLKRKKGNIIEEANKMRRLNAAANGVTESPTPSATPTPAPSPPRPSGISTPGEPVVIDPGAKARGSATSGGAVDPEVDKDGNAITPAVKPSISLAPGQAPWIAVLNEIIPYLTDPAWQSRHGASLAVMEILRSTNLGDDLFLSHISRQLISLMTLDRFGDFVGDIVIAPVRETAAQALGVLLRYLDYTGVREVHTALMGMVQQSWAKRGKEADGLPKYEKFAWEVRHAGLLGLKYEVAVRADLLAEQVEAPNMDEDEKPDTKRIGATFLQDVVNAAILAMRDQDDDVRTVAATALLPITSQLASSLPREELALVLDTLWDCLAEGGDELGSSTGAIMDLLGAMIAHPEVIDLMSDESRETGSRSRQTLISRIYVYIRHSIYSVRLSVARILHTFAIIPSLPKADWMLGPFLQLLFQNLVLEQHPDIRQLSMAAFEAALNGIAPTGNSDRLISGQIENWYKMVMTTVGSPFDPSLLLRVARTGGHDVDKPMMEGDLGLVSTNTMLETRIVASNALATLKRFNLSSISDTQLIKNSLFSGGAHQVFMAATIVQEWALDADRPMPSSETLPQRDADANMLSELLIKRIESPPPATYTEMTTILARIGHECQALLNAFGVEGKINKDRIPQLPTKVDPLSNASDVFSLATAQQVIGPTFDGLSRLLTKTAIKNVLPSLQDRQRKLMGSIGYFSVMKERYDVQVNAGVAGALIALRTMPAKFGGVIKAVMDSVKKEENEVLQTRSAQSVASFVQFCGSPQFSAKINPSDKVVRNLWTFLCSDTSITPVFSTQVGLTDDILSLKEEKIAVAKRNQKDAPEETDEQIAQRITRRGALQAFEAMALRFGSSLFLEVPKFWEGISAALLTSFPPDTPIAQLDAKLSGNPTLGQDLVDCLTSLRLVASQLDPSLHPRVLELFPHIILALSSSFSVIRNTAARCLAVLCSVMLDEGMKRVVDDVVPMIGNAKSTAARQGAAEAVHHIIKELDIRALPYILFLIVPILGRMSDPDDQVRLLSTSTFASLVKMVPLEAGIPDPPGFSAELLAKRDDERKFLMQLLDGSKAEQYEIPIPIKADLRQYQKDGVSWLAFLAKYQLHGILCDDMGLGKSLQSICIVGSKHFERAEKHRSSKSVDSAHLPSVIICPPTLTGHWYYEIQKFTDYLRPYQYVGSSIERAGLRSKLGQYDVVITSYDIVRADIAELSKMNWLYCVLDEGHIIKNAKTKLSAAVKQIRAQHRLLLSGTPIQNNVLELWSLFDFLMPGFLGSERVFNDKFSKPILADRDGKATPKEREAASTALEALHKQVLPFLLRRLKEDVLHDLPPKIIQDYYCELSPIQKHLYDEFSKSRAAEEAGEEVNAEAPGQGHVFQSLQYLRKLCNHPALVLQGEESRFNDIRKRIGGEVASKGLHDITHAPKLEALRQLLLDCGIGLPAAEKLESDASAQHRVLIFCQLRPMLDLIESDLFKTLMPTVSYMRMDGSTETRKRHAVVQTFNNDPRIDVLLLTTSVGGLGLNLTGADTVIFVDHDWNPMKDLQAMDRAHRLGQKKVVNVYRLITRGTLEEKIMGLQRFKLNIASSVVTQQNAGLGSMNTGEVLDLFKVSAEGEAPKAPKESSGPVSASKILEGLEDLPPDDEYAELSLENFLNKM